MYRPNLRGRGRGGTAISKASSVLSRASSQLKGGQATSAKDENDDDIGAYLSALSKRANAQPQLANANDLAESEDEDNPPLAVEAPSSKFLKKKNPAAPVQYDEGDGAKYQARTDVRPSGVPRSDDGVPGKAPGYADKFGSHSAAGRGEILHLSESDMDLSFSLDDSILAQATKTTKVVADTAQPFKDIKENKEEVHSSQKYHKPKSTESDNSAGIGKGGNRFLKKKNLEPATGLQREEPATAKRKPRTAHSVSKSAGMKSATHLMLDSDDESMQGYIQNLTDTANSSRVSTPKTPRSIKTPRSLTTMEDISEEAETSKSERQRQRTDDLSNSSNDSFKINVMDLNALEPATLPVKEDRRPAERAKQKPAVSETKKADKKANQSGRKSDKCANNKDGIKKASRKTKDKKPQKKREENKKNSEKKIEKTSNFFSSMGLRSLDELFSVEDDDKASDVSEVSSTVQPSEPHHDFHAVSRSPSPLRSILSGSSRPVTPKSSRVRLSLNDEITEIRSRSPSPEVISTARGSAAAYTQDFDTESAAERVSSGALTPRSGAYSDSASSYSSTRSMSSRRSSRSTQSSRSTRSTRSTRSRATTGTEDGYSDDFVTEGSRRSGRSHSPVTKSADSRSISPLVRTKRRPKVRKRNAAIQTGVDLEAGLIYHWNVENSVTVVGQQYGLGYVDPTPIASHIVSADSLEAMTAYNPSSVALNNMLRQQLALTTDFIEAQKQLHRHLLGSLAMQHHYTTLEDTKRYIKQHRKPTLSFDEALRQVKEEMALL